TSEGGAENIPLGVLVARSSNQELKNSFEKREQEEPYTEASSLAKLEEAFKKWQELSEETKGRFNSKWLENNGFEGLYNWGKRKTSEGGAKNIPLGVLVARSSNQELKNSFEKQEQEEPYTEASALAKLEEAFKKWQELPEETRGKLNSKWLEKNGFKGLYNWCIKKTSEGGAKNIPLEDLVARSSNQELKNSFEKRANYTK
ncbi:MAG: hypothetical protein HY981_00005, partial [Candidatus Magasanikbacteria bacterium]|nr:hypothetical protein [Candidatus Magasanikbacteria bacterium]